MKNVLTFEEYSLNEGFDIAGIKTKVQDFFKTHFADNLSGKKKVIDRIEKEFGDLSKEERNEKVKEIARELKKSNLKGSASTAFWQYLIAGMVGAYNIHSFSEGMLCYILFLVVNMFCGVTTNLWVDKTVKDYIAKK